MPAFPFWESATRGFQTMAAALGDTQLDTGTREYGHTDAEVVGESCLFAGTPAGQVVWMSHGDAVQAAPDGFTVTASTKETPVAAFENRERKLFGLVARGQAFRFRARRPSKTSSMTVPGSRQHGQANLSLTPRWPRSASRWAMLRSSARCPAGWIPPLPRRWCTKRSAISSRASSLITGCCGPGEREQVEGLRRGHGHPDGDS